MVKCSEKAGKESKRLAPSGPTFEDRIAAGKALRAKCPRSSQGDFASDRHGRDPVALIKESNLGRLPDLVPIRHQRMLASPFAFYRGTASIMGHDLARSPASGLRVQASGDCHLCNFGVYSTPERNLIFDLNDFDETLPAPWEWDVKRLGASFVLAARARGLEDSDGSEIAATAARSYRVQIARFAEMRVLEVWYSRLDEARVARDAPTAVLRRRLEEGIAEARAATAEKMLPRMTEFVDGRRRIVNRPPYVLHMAQSGGAYERLVRLFSSYRRSLPADRRFLLDRYRMEDTAVKVVGVGSVGTRCGVILLLASENDPLFLQINEARPSVLEPFAGRSRFVHQGERVVTGQRLMQAASDLFLGWASDEKTKHHYYFRQLKDMKWSADVEQMSKPALLFYAEVCGWALARAHAKGGDAAMIRGYLGRAGVFDEAVAKFARAYANQVEKDFAAFTRACRSGTLRADISTTPHPVGF